MVQLNIINSSTIAHFGRLKDSITIFTTYFDVKKNLNFSHRGYLWISHDSHSKQQSFYYALLTV
jgi:hypothetical protein